MSVKRQFTPCGYKLLPMRLIGMASRQLTLIRLAGCF